MLEPFWNFKIGFSSQYFLPLKEFFSHSKRENFKNKVLFLVYHSDHFSQFLVIQCNFCDKADDLEHISVSQFFFYRCTTTPGNALLLFWEESKVYLLTRGVETSGQHWWSFGKFLDAMPSRMVVCRIWIRSIILLMTIGQLFRHGNLRQPFQVASNPMCRTLSPFLTKAHVHSNRNRQFSNLLWHPKASFLALCPYG